MKESDEDPNKFDNNPNGKGDPNKPFKSKPNNKKPYDNNPKGRRVKLKAKMKALGQVPRLLVEVPEQIGSSGLSWAMKSFEKAYSKVTKNKSDGEVMSDMDMDDSSEDVTVEERPKKKGLFSFWK